MKRLTINDLMSDKETLNKFCIDIKRRRICIDEEMHIDMEHELFDDGSEYGDVFGGDIVFSGDKDTLDSIPYNYYKGSSRIKCMW